MDPVDRQTSLNLSIVDNHMKMVSPKHDASGGFAYGNSSDVIVPMELQLVYTVLEILVAIVAIVGNGMVILVFWRERRLRRRTNYYIVSLAVADLLVGLLGIPFAIMASIGLPTNLHACLFTLSLLIVLCTISIFCLVAVSVDRYWAILHPLGYSRNVRTKTAIVIISLCWVAGSVIGFLPLFGWHAATSNHISCFFVQVMNYDFLVFLYFATIITPSLVLAAFYAHIYRVVLKQLRQIVTMNPAGGSSFRSIQGGNNNAGQNGGTMLRVLGAAQKREVKATQNLSIIVLFFIICWIPLYTINCVKAFCPDCYIGATWTDFFIILSHLNSAVNPILYAYHLRDFRAALKSLLYSMFNIKESSNSNDTYYKPSIISQQTQNRKQSNFERRTSNFHNNQPKIYVDSPVWLRQKAAEMASTPEAQNTPRTGSPNSNEISVLNLPNASSIPECMQHRKMWMISEVPSNSDEREISEDGIPTIAQINKSHCTLQTLPDDYDEDDDVFLPSINGELASTRYDFKDDDNFTTDIPFRERTNSLSDLSEDYTNTGNHIKTEEQQKYHDNLNRTIDSSRGMSPKSSIFIVDSDSETTKLSPKFKADPEFKKLSKLDNKRSFSINSDNFTSSSNNVKMSPLKIVNDFFHPNRRSSHRSKADENKSKKGDPKPKQSSSDIFQYLDLHRNGIEVQKYTAKEDVNDR